MEKELNIRAIVDHDNKMCGACCLQNNEEAFDFIGLLLAGMDAQGWNIIEMELTEEEKGG